MSTMLRTPSVLRTRKIDRQPKVVDRRLPTRGARPGPATTTKFMAARRRAASVGPAVSRTMARPEHQPGASAEGLEQARDDESVDVRRQESPDAGAHLEEQTDQEDRSSPEIIGERTVDQLPERESDDIEADRHLHDGDAGTQVPRCVRQGRHEHVHCQGAAEGDENQQPEA